MKFILFSICFWFVLFRLSPFIVSLLHEIVIIIIILCSVLLLPFAVHLSLSLSWRNVAHKFYLRNISSVLQWMRDIPFARRRCLPLFHARQHWHGSAESKTECGGSDKPWYSFILVLQMYLAHESIRHIGSIAACNSRVSRINRAPAASPSPSPPPSETIEAESRIKRGAKRKKIQQPNGTRRGLWWTPAPSS